MPDQKARVILEAKRRNSGAFKSFRRDLDSISSRAAIVGTAAAAAIAVVTKKSFESIDALAKFSDRVGIATESLASLRLAGELTGVANNQLDLGLQRMTRRVAEAAQGMGEAQGALRELGLDAKQVASLPVDEQFKVIAEQMANVETQSDRVRLAFKLFDSEGVALVNTLRLGAEGLDAIEQEAIAMGVAVNRVDAAKIEQANDAVLRAKSAIEGLANTFAIALAPAVTALSDAFSDAATGSDDLHDQVRDAVEFMVKGVGIVADGVHGWKLVFKGVETSVLDFASFFAGTIASLLEIIDKLKRAVSDAFSIDTEEAQARIDDLNARIQELPPESGFRKRLEDDLRYWQRTLANAKPPPELSGGGGLFRGIQDSLAASADYARDQFMALGQSIKPSEQLADSWERAKVNAEAAARATAEQRTALGGSGEGLGMTDEDARAAAAADAAAEVEAARFAASLEQVRQFTLTREEVELEAIQNRMMILAQARENGLIEDERFQQLSLEVARRGQEALTKIAESGFTERQKFAAKSTKAQAQHVLGNLEQMTAGVATTNKAIFNLNKAAAIGSAVMNTAQGVTRALAEYPPPISFAMAAAQAAAGAAQIAAIKAASFGSGTTPSVAGSTPTSAGQPVLQPLPTLNQESRSQAIINIQIEGGVNGSGGIEELTDLLQENLRERIEDRDEVLFTRSSRQGQI